ncbi:calmodulin-like protein 3 [Tanacetum coccineum]
MIPYHKNLTARGYRALIFSGDHDMCVPFTGSEAWTRSLGYKVIDEWRHWLVDGQVSGFTQGYDNNLTFLTVKLIHVMQMDPAELRRVFQMFDRNGDGKITKQELAKSLENLGIYIPDDDLAQMIEKIDVNKDGFVDMEEFGELYQTILGERDEEEDMREAFNVFDQNRDGFITVEELRSVLSSLGLRQGRSIEECRLMIKKVDEDGDGMVNYKEFKQMMKAGGFAGLET